MEEPHAHWMVVTDALRPYVTRRGLANIPPHGRTAIIEAIAREIAHAKTLMGVVPGHQQDIIAQEVTGASKFLHALRQADEGLPRRR